MDKNSLSEYGWIIIVILLLSFMLAFVSVIMPNINKTSHDVVEYYFPEDKTPAKPQLSPPSLSVSGDTLTIVDATELAEQYEIHINGVYVDIISATHPSTSYELHTEFEETFIEVRSVAANYLPSEKSWIFHNSYTS